MYYSPQTLDDFHILTIPNPDRIGAVSMRNPKNTSIHPIYNL